MKSTFDAQSGLEDFDVGTTVQKLLSYCEAEGWSGYDPYDALNSRLLSALRFLDSRIPRIVATQLLKRSPINVRGLMRVPRTLNAKALALFLAALVRLSRCGLTNQKRRAAFMIDRLIALRSPGMPYWCWGYSFPWQTRTVLVPAGAPNLVCTCFVGDGLLDAYGEWRDSSCLGMAVSAADYIVNELYWTSGKSVGGFAYPRPDVQGQVHNGNLLAAAFLCRVYAHTGEARYLVPALEVARFSAAMQRPDGSWPYGEAPSQHWIDNFHTGFNLCALRSMCRSLETVEFEPYVRRGFTFYRNHFFRGDGAPCYFASRSYPVDMHCVAQSIITLLTLNDVDRDNVALARSVLRWAMSHMWDDRGFFYYRALRLFTNRISYMRWSQAWMLLGMATLLDGSPGGDPTPGRRALDGEHD